MALTLDYCMPSDDIISLWRWVFWRCYDKKRQVPLKNQYETGNESGSVQSDSKATSQKQYKFLLAHFLLGHSP